MTSRTTAPSSRFRATPAIEAVGDHLRALPVPRGARRWLKQLYHQALMLQSGGRGLRHGLPGGEVVYGLPAYRQIGWNPNEYSAFRAAVRPGMVAFDVGANVGAYSLLLAQWVGGTGHVFAFEPVPDLHEGLRRHIALNGADDVITAMAAAVGDEEGTATLLLSETAGESRIARPRDAIGRSITAPMLTIDGFCARERVSPDFIKIDVEGFEAAVLRGARETIRARGGSLALFVELHPSTWPAIGLSREAVLDELAAQRLAWEPIGDADPWTVEGVSVRLRSR
jgi:FkbM family methyltransferase